MECYLLKPDGNFVVYFSTLNFVEIHGFIKEYRKIYNGELWLRYVDGPFKANIITYPKVKRNE